MLVDRSNEIHFLLASEVLALVDDNKSIKLDHSIDYREDRAARINIDINYLLLQTLLNDLLQSQKVFFALQQVLLQSFHLFYLQS